MRNLVLVALSLSILLLPITTLAQHEDHHELNSAEHTNGYFRAAVLIGHTFVPTGPEPDRLAVPSWGLDLEYWFSHKWGIGLHNDLEIETFLVEHEGQEEVLTREYPLVLTVDALVKPWKQLVLLVGPGLELERTENFFLVRAGVEYEFELGHGWDISPTFFYDTRQNAYDTWSIALGVGKRLN
ncbi:MAG: hypothetical protein H6560_14090 [Lewinellaceae bacterium]|nr:hypothetical protein [Lewinellaceae bacterium]